MRFYFHEHAETEFDRTVEYYEDCRHGLGIELAQSENVLEQLTQEAFMEYEKGNIQDLDINKL